MTEGNETPIGALRADGTEKPEAAVMRNFAKFAAELSPHLRNPQPAQVAIIASQAAQYSAIAQAQIEAQRKCVRALAYYSRLTPYAIYENEIDQLQSPKLAILPSAQALTENAWQALLKYVEGGGTLLITGPIDRDEHWQRVNRAAQLFPGAAAMPLTFHSATQATNQAGKTALDLTFEQEAQSWLEYLHFNDGSSMKQTSRGKGRIIWAAYPVELAQDEIWSGLFYTPLAGMAGVAPQSDEVQPLSPGVMAYPVPLGDSILYIFVSDNASDSRVDIRDRSTGTKLTFTLSAEHAALALIGKKEKAVIAKYGF